MTDTKAIADLPIDGDQGNDIVTVVNRSSKPLSAFFDGRQYQIAPRSKKFLTWQVANALKRSNPIMGTEDPYSLSMKACDFLIGVVEWGDDCSFIEQSAAVERFDTSMLPDSEKRQLARNARPSRHKSRSYAVVDEFKRPNNAVFAPNFGTSEG